MRIILLSDEALRLELTDGPMTIEASSPELSFSPFHMLASSLASCTLSVLHTWASHAELPADDLALEVRWTFAENPHRVDELRLRIDWPSLPDRRRAAVSRVAKVCTVHATLSHPPRIVTEEITEAEPATRA